MDVKKHAEKEWQQRRAQVSISNFPLAEQKGAENEPIRFLIIQVSWDCLSLLSAAAAAAAAAGGVASNTCASPFPIVLWSAKHFFIHLFVHYDN